MVKSIDSISHEELQKEFLRMREEMLAEISALRSQVSELKETVHEQKVEIDDLKLRNQILEERYTALLIAKYQSQKNKFTFDMPTLFDDAELEAMSVEKEMETSTVGEHQRKKSPKKEQHISYDHLEHVIEKVSISEEDLICDICGNKMQVKKYEEREELIIVPARAYVRVLQIPILECVECQSVNEEGKSSYKRIKKENPLFPRSMASAESLAYILDQKYNLGLPLYAVEKVFSQMNVVLPRQNMANWIIQSVKYLSPIYNLMKEDLLKENVIHADETTTQVLNEVGKIAESTSYMFVYHTTEDATPIVLYDYRSSRSGDAPREFLKGSSGIYLVSDAYDGYNKVEHVQRAFCHVHGLRKFKEAYKLLDKRTKNKEQTDEANAIKKYQEIFHLETIFNEDADKLHLTGEQRYEYITKRRQEESKPKLDEFFLWLKDMNTYGKDKLTKAKKYMLNNQTEFYCYLQYGRIPMSNNICEQAIRPFVVNRNRCKFYVSPKGATASALIYSIVITCIQNKISPYGYFLHVLKKLPNMDLKNEEELRKLLPYSKDLPDYLELLTPQAAKAKVRQLTDEIDELNSSSD